MPSPTVEQLQKKEASIKKALAEMGDAPDQAKQRAMRKKLKRAQRRRRLDVALAARNAPKPKEAPATAPAEESKEE